MKFSFLLMLVILLPTVTLANVTTETCEPFFQALDQVPHESIFQEEGLFASQGFEVGVTGCLVAMVTNEARMNGQSLPEFSVEPGTALYQDGWRSDNKYMADAPGTGVVGIKKDSTLCLYYSEQPAHIDESGEINQNVAIKARVECMDVVQAGCPEDMVCEEE